MPVVSKLRKNFIIFHTTYEKGALKELDVWISAGEETNNKMQNERREVNCLEEGKVSECWLCILIMKDFVVLLLECERTVWFALSCCEIRSAQRFIELNGDSGERGSAEPQHCSSSPRSAQIRLT